MLPRANCAFVLPDLVNEAYFPHTDYLTWPLHYNCSTDDLSKELYFQAASYEGNIVTYCETIASKWICRLTSFQNTETCCIEQISLNRLQQFLWSCLEKVVVGCFSFWLEGGCCLYLILLQKGVWLIWRCSLISQILFFLLF